MNIRVDLTTPIYDGTEVVFRSPVDCSQITGLIVYYNGGSKEFTFADAHGNDVGNIDHLFGENVVVKVILDVTRGMAFVQNADTNSYLEERFANIGSGKVPLVRFDLTRNMLDVAGDMVLPDGTPWRFTRGGNASVPRAYSTLDQVHALYDDLVKKYPHLWSKLDAAEVMSSVWYEVLYDSENKEYQITNTQVKFETYQIIDGALTTDGRSVYQYKTKDGEEGYCCFEDVYPAYAKGIPSSKNLFNPEWVAYDFVKPNAANTSKADIYIDWNGIHIDILLPKDGGAMRVSTNELNRLVWLPGGTYTFSYILKQGSGIIRPFAVNMNDVSISDGKKTYGFTQLKDETGEPYEYSNEDKTTIDRRIAQEFVVNAGGAYVTLRRTSDAAMGISNVQIEAGKSATYYVDYKSAYVPAYNYRLTEDGVCKEWLPVDATGDDLITHYYKPTPAYKTYLYKFSFENNSMHAKPGLANEKKKIFLTSSVNGDERTAPFNSYLFCKRLCEVFNEKTEDGDYYYDDDYFKFAQAFDIYIVPCINGYGQYHNLRWNANGVQIDRNFNTGYWVAPDRKNGGVTFVPETQDYPGVKPDSEFETLLIEKLTEKIKPDMAIDLHNYTSILPRQFYTGVAKKEWMPLLYQSCADCSIAFKRKYPQYFGTSIDLVRDARDYRLEYAATNGEVTTWWRTKGNVYFPSLIEVCQTINYNNGELVGTWDNGKYNSTSTAGLDLQGPGTFSVAEYTVRNQLMRYGQFVLENKV